MLEQIPSEAIPIKILRIVTSFLETIEPENISFNEKHANVYGPREISIRLIALFGPCLFYWWHYVKSNGQTRI